MQKSIINVYCKNHGWLFEDLKRWMADLGAVASNEPLPDADAYICIRTMEFKKSPKPERTVVQVHDLRKYRIERAGCVSFVHPAQQQNFPGFQGNRLLLPIGSRDIEIGEYPETPTIGFFCREVRRQKGSLLFEEAVDLARKFADFRVLMIGYGLDHIKHLGRYERRAAGPHDYQRLTALAVCSQSVMVPLSAYEACAAGRLVLSTTRQWPEGFGWKMVKTVDDSEGMARLIVEGVKTPRSISPEVPFRRRDWARAQIREAQRLAEKLHLETGR